MGNGKFIQIDDQEETNNVTLKNLKFGAVDSLPEPSRAIELRKRKVRSSNENFSAVGP